ncbi:PREDICTED: uncharacterized protein LOC105564612, partial [Vollenhovia emeryi]|uniref:uncharacterized protein LOC105564612 n=1 Tax=Vollenhovia emeryi TaxID=411798 RepID=UPI0005F3C090
MAHKQQYALIKWIEDDTYTLGVPIDWIKYFEYDTFISGNYDLSRSVPIEWRNTRKEPHGGWPCYDGLIIAVSGKISKLEKKLKIFEGTKSSKRVTVPEIEHSSKKKKGKKYNKIYKENEDNNDSFKRAEKRLGETSKNKSYLNKKTKLTTEEYIDYEIPSTSYSQETTGKMIPRNIVFDEENIQQVILNSSHSEDDFNIDTTKTYSVNKITLETLHEDNLKIQAMIQQLFKSISKAKLTLTESNDTSTSLEEEMVEIQPGSGVKVRTRDWKLALSRPTFTAMGRTLLTLLFPHEVLLRSNLKGGPSKIKRTDGKAAFTALNPRILSALI